jgi:leader peptidase (prepilin peptidase)/N-methyltransferase
MAAMIGAFTGWQGVVASIFLGAFVGTVIFLPTLFREKKPLVPFGIFLALGAAAWLVAGPRMTAWYAGLLAW